MSSLVKWIVDVNLCAFFERTEGKSLFVFIREYSFTKKLLDIASFSIKFVTNLSTCNNAEIKSIFYYLSIFLI